MKRPQEPKKPYPYREEEVSVRNEAGGVTLAGTFTLPKAGGPHPAVVLITGSGPQDRDEAVAGHRPFLVLADYLTRQGIAVLRCDDRGVNKSTGNFATAVEADFVGDTLACVAFLRSRPDIDAAQIGLVGHSEGGIIAPRAAVKSSDIAFIVLLAGVGVRMDELLLRQGRDIAAASGAAETVIERNARAQREIFALLRTEKDPARLEARFEKIVAAQLASVPPDQRKQVGLTDAQLAGQKKVTLSPWFRDFLDYDPANILPHVRCPVLALGGAKDLQVAAKENLAAIQSALTSGGNSRVTTIELPGLNHLFQTCATGSPAEYSRIEETFNPAAMKLIVDWIHELIHELTR